jgi:hypothetical protein
VLGLRPAIGIETSKLDLAGTVRVRCALWWSYEVSVPYSTQYGIEPPSVVATSPLIVALMSVT